MKDIIDYLVEQGVRKTYVRELIFENDEVTEVSSSIHLTKENRDNYFLEDMNKIKIEDYEIDILELKKVMYITAVSIKNTEIITDKYAKNNLENGKEICFTKEQLNWSKDNISHFYSLSSLYPFVKRLEVK